MTAERGRQSAASQEEDSLVVNDADGDRKMVRNGRHVYLRVFRAGFVNRVWEREIETEREVDD